MIRTKLMTALVTVISATGAVGLTIWNQSEPRPPVPVVAASLSAPAALTDHATTVRPVPAPIPDAALIPVLPRDTLAAPQLASPGLSLPDRMARHEPAARTVLPTESEPLTVRRNALGIPCGATLSGSARPPAMVSLTLTAPCRPNAQVNVRHGDLEFTGLTDGLGTLVVQMPALVDPAVFEVVFPDGTREETEVIVPDLAEVTRVALQWTGALGLSLHAFEFGASYGEAGHIWSDAPRSPEAAVLGRGGFLTRLGIEGADAKVAEVYSYPSGATLSAGVVRLAIEAEVTDANCGLDIQGASLQPGPAGGMDPVSLTLAMPGCDAVGEFLVLKNVLRDLRIAAR